MNAALPRVPASELVDQLVSAATALAQTARTVDGASPAGVSATERQALRDAARGLRATAADLLACAARHAACG